MLVHAEGVLIEPVLYERRVVVVPRRQPHLAMIAQDFGELLVRGVLLARGRVGNEERRLGWSVVQIHRV